MKIYLFGGILVKVDCMSMVYLLEVCVFILDCDVIEFVVIVLLVFKFKDGEKKYIFKEVFKLLLFDDILYCKKMGFFVLLD